MKKVNYYWINNFRGLVFFITLLLSQLAAAADTVTAPEPYGVCPADRQLKWHKLGFYGFIHFTVNTFTDSEWGAGDEKESVFNPTDFSAEQIVSTAKKAGLKGLILTCKHHDGFCLWPSKYTEHSIKNSPYKNGKGDIVKEMSDECARQGIKFGVYLSPWDRNSKYYGTPEYITYYRNQLKELLSNYGPVFEVWFDGANGGKGYYGGANEVRKIDNLTYYDWPNTFKIVRELQPDAVMFSDVGPDVRWCGTERGFVGDPCWATTTYPLIKGKPATPGSRVGRAVLSHGVRNGKQWTPAESDVSIRPGWFYHESQNSKVKTPEQLLDIYFKTVGRGGSLLLNLPPDKRGRIPDTDVASLMGFKKILDDTFAKNLAADAKVSASNVRGDSSKFKAENMLDGNDDTYWAADDGVTTPVVDFKLPKETTFDVVELKEYIPLGQRVDSCLLQYLDKNGKWVDFAQFKSVGSRRLWYGKPVTTTAVRLRVCKSPVCPCISEFGLYRLPENIKPQEIVYPKRKKKRKKK